MSLHLLRQIDHLKQQLLFVGTSVEEQIARAVQSLVNRDGDLARRVIEGDDEIDRLEVQVEEECLKTLALYQPVAADLRFVVTILKINNDLERMGDLAVNIAKRSAFLSICPPSDIIDDVRAMAVKAQSMVKRSLDSLVNHDAVLARQVRQDDDEVDALRDSVRQRVGAELRQSPEAAACVMKWNSVSKHLERLGDMATNIAEDVLYMVEGEIVRHRHES